ncbi:unnamed protein product [Boreogadus saida]
MNKGRATQSDLAGLNLGIATSSTVWGRGRTRRRPEQPGKCTESVHQEAPGGHHDDKDELSGSEHATKRSSPGSLVCTVHCHRFYVTRETEQPPSTNGSLEDITSKSL